MSKSTLPVIQERANLIARGHKGMEDLYQVLGSGIRRQFGRIALEEINRKLFERNEDYVADRTVELLHLYSPGRLLRLSHDSNGLASVAEPYMRFIDDVKVLRVRELADSLVDEGQSVLTVGFLDDVAMAHHIDQLYSTGKTDAAYELRQRNGLSLESLEAGAQADYVAQESNYRLAGRAIVAKIQEGTLPDGYRLSRSGSKLLVVCSEGEVQISLTGFDNVDGPNHPSCAVLDLAWLQHRLRLAPIATTILPVGYEKQQRAVRLVAGALSDMPSGTVESIFVEDDGSIDHIVTWKTGTSHES